VDFHTVFYKQRHATYLISLKKKKQKLKSIKEDGELPYFSTNLCKIGGEG